MKKNNLDIGDLIGAFILGFACGILCYYSFSPPTERREEWNQKNVPNVNSSSLSMNLIHDPTGQAVIEVNAKSANTKTSTRTISDQKKELRLIANSTTQKRQDESQSRYFVNDAAKPSHYKDTIQITKDPYTLNGSVKNVIISPTKRKRHNAFLPSSEAREGVNLTVDPESGDNNQDRAGVIPPSSLRAPRPCPLLNGPKCQITETQQQERSGRYAVLPSQDCKVGKQQSRPTFFDTKEALKKTLEEFTKVVKANNVALEQLQAEIKRLKAENKKLSIIRQAAERNNCYGDDFLILLAIRKQENGRKDCEFGVEKVWDTDLETQAAWAAATIVKSRGRWEKAGRPNDFIAHLAKEYCPLDCFIWEKNVTHWFEKFKCKVK